MSDYFFSFDLLLWWRWATPKHGWPYRQRAQLDAIADESNA